MNEEARAILNQCLQHEKEGLDFYRQAAATVARERTRRAFQTLIREEEEHIRKLFETYQGPGMGTAETFLKAPPHIESPLVKELESAVDPETPDRKALEIAMRLEEENRADYGRHAETVQDPESRSVYRKLAEDEDRHYQVVESEYAHLMAMVHETDMDTYVRE